MYESKKKMNKSTKKMSGREKDRRKKKKVRKGEKGKNNTCVGADKLGGKKQLTMNSSKKNKKISQEEGISNGQKESDERKINGVIECDVEGKKQ